MTGAGTELAGLSGFVRQAQVAEIAAVFRATIFIVNLQAESMSELILLLLRTVMADVKMPAATVLVGATKLERRGPSDLSENQSN